MKVKVLKGTNQIGGCVTEITSDNGKKIIIDFGEDLPDEEKNKQIKFELEGLTYGEKKYEAVFITHSHGDHIGLIESVLKEIPIYIEETSLNIFEKTKMYTTRDFDSGYSMDKSNYRTFKTTKEEPIEIDDFCITPYKVDHSAYNSAMFLIECNDKKILHTGDFRAHGRNGDTLDNIIKKVGSIDCVITEGTSLGRSESEYISEEKLQDELTSIMRKYNQVFVLQSSTNIDRITTFYKAKGNKAFVMDQFTCEITSLVNRSIPNPIGNLEGQKYCRLFTYKPLAYIGEREKAYNNSTWHDKDRKFNGFRNQEYILMVKSSMIKDIKKVHDKNKKVVLIYSMWEGYIEKQDKMKEFLSDVEKLGIDVIIKHTSGHADIKTLKNLDERLGNPMVIPIHTNNVDEAKKVFKNAKILNDNEEIEIMKEENKILKLMLDKKETYLRIREDELIVYKNGGKMLRQTKNDIEIFPNRLKLNRTAVKSDIIDNIINDITILVGELIDLNYQIKLKKIELKKSKKFEIGSQDEFNDILEEVRGILEANSNELNHVIVKTSGNILVDSSIEFKTKEEYKDFLEIWKKLIDKTVDKKGICNMISVDIDIKGKLNECDFKKIIDLSEKMLINYDNYRHEKTDGIPNDEKAFQQKIMDIVNNNHSTINKEHLYENKTLSPFNKDIEPFELEWVEENGNIKARIDNIFFDKEKNKIILCEVKYNEGVIGGTNGLHKHLHDMQYILLDEKRKSKFIQKIVKCVKYRNIVLNKNYQLNENCEIECWIICGYEKNKQSVVKDELDKICANNQLISDKSKEAKVYLEKTKQVNPNNIKGYIGNLEELECPITIYMVDEELEEFESYSVK